MAVDPSRFVTEEQTFGGLYKAADTLERNKQRQEALDYKREGKRAAASTFLNQYLDSKDFLTGTNYDPEIIKQLQETMYEGAKLASEGADTPTIMMALSPKVSRLSEYSTKAKLVNQRLKEQMAQIKPNMGYDLKSLESEARRLAFYGEGDKLKDISTIDPETDWLTETIRLYPERVTNDAAIDEFAKNSPKFTEVKDVSRYNAQRGMTRNRAKITSTNWQIPEVDERGAVTGLVPKYQIALEDGQPMMHEFTDEKGNKTKAPVRLLDEQEFKSIMSSNPGIADWVRGQVKKLGGGNLNLNSPQATNLARAILYDELKRRSAGSIEDIEVQKANPAPIVHVRVGDTQSKNPGGDWVKRATAAVQGGNDQTIQDEFAQLFQGDKNGFESVKVENGKVKVTYKTPEKNNLLGQLIPSEPKTVEIDVNDRYLSNKLANVYQTIMGGDVKVERTQYGKTPATRPEAKTYNVLDPSGKVVMQGVSKEAADKAKAKGYTIQ